MTLLVTGITTSLGGQFLFQARVDRGVERNAEVSRHCMQDVLLVKLRQNIRVVREQAALLSPERSFEECFDAMPG